MKPLILVWDLPIRIFHWTLALSFLGAYLTAESERWRDVHVMLGFTVLGLLTFRLVWGLVGTRHARFGQFVRGPRAVYAYLVDLTNGRPAHYSGHNPLGAVAIVGLIALGFASCLSGWLLYDGMMGERLDETLEELHEVLSNGMLALVCLHVIGVIHGSVLHKENLAWAMVTGRKRGAADEEIHDARPWIGMAVISGLLAFWVWGSLGAFEYQAGTQFSGSDDGIEGEQPTMEHDDDSDDDDD